MTTRLTIENPPLGMIDVQAIEQQARALRSEVSREIFAAIGSFLKKLLVPSTPAGKAKSHIRAWA